MMQSSCLTVIFAAVLLAHAAPPQEAGPTYLKFCTSNQTVSSQILTNPDSDEVFCQCTRGPVKGLSSSVAKSDYVHTPGIGSHKLHTDAKSWNNARKICVEEGGHLAIINSLAEEAILSGMLTKAVDSIKGGLNKEEALVGIHDLYKEGEWVTIFGESLYATGYSHWSPTYKNGQPDNFAGNQNCGAVLDQGGMDDVNCNDRFAFFCELPSTYIIH